MAKHSGRIGKKLLGGLSAVGGVRSTPTVQPTRRV
jgi:hypothetical protein